MRYLITGASGFVGSHLFTKLKKLGTNIIGIDNFSHSCDFKYRNEIKFADIRYYNDIAPFVEWCDFVIHLAAQIHVDKSIRNPEETIDTNVKGTLNILEAVRRYDKKMIFASTSEVYGTAQTEVMNESHPTNPQSPYAASKLAADGLCRAYHQTYGTKVIILRNFNIFGPCQNAGEGAGSSYGAVIAIFVNNALKNRNLMIFGDGKQERDYMYIDDAIRTYKLCIEKFDKLNGKVLNMGTGKTININYLAQKVIELTKSKSKIIHVQPRDGEVRRLCCGNYIASQYGLIPKTNFEQDLIKYINWVKKTNYGL